MNITPVLKEFSEAIEKQSELLIKIKKHCEKSIADSDSTNGRWNLAYEILKIMNGDNNE